MPNEHSTHHVHRGAESLPCYCAATSDHTIGHEQTPSPSTPLVVSDKMVMAGCLAAYGEDFPKWPDNSIHDGKMMVSKVLRAALVDTQEAPQQHLHELAAELLQALCKELRLNRGEHQDLINRARAALTPPPQPRAEG